MCEFFRGSEGEFRVRERRCTHTQKRGRTKEEKKKKVVEKKNLQSHTFTLSLTGLISLSHTTAIRIDDDERRRSVSRSGPRKDGESGGDQEGV